MLLRERSGVLEKVIHVLPDLPERESLQFEALGGNGVSVPLNTEGAAVLSLTIVDSPLGRALTVAARKI